MIFHQKKTTMVIVIITSLMTLFINNNSRCMAFATSQPTTTISRISSSSKTTPNLKVINGRFAGYRSHNHHRSKMTSMAAIRLPRGGGAAATAAASEVVSSSSPLSTLLATIKNSHKTPSGLFNGSLALLALMTVILKLTPTSSSSSSASSEANNDETKTTTTVKAEKPASIKSLQTRFLLVFWLLRCADWLQGPYFYEVYASKSFGGSPPSISLISKLFLTGFASTALAGPFVGRAVDSYGRKRGTLAFTLFYAIGALSTRSGLLGVLFLGRFMNGVGTSLLFSAPEAWLVGESQKVEGGGGYLGETFGLAYAGDSIVAIIAGQLAALAASQRGPSGPFELSVLFLIMGGLLATSLWKENVAETTTTTDGDNNNNNSSNKPTIRDAIEMVKSDPKIQFVGGVQALFEAAMYIFVLQWPPAMTKAIQSAFGGSSATPYGTIFSCFMASCLLGSSFFGRLATSDNVTTETSTSVMLSVATIAMSLAALVSSGVVEAGSGVFSFLGRGALLIPLTLAFFVFEACVGMYFPSIGTLRSRYVPDSHRSVIMNLFGIPLNVLVVAVYLFMKQLGVGGALSVSAGALGVATGCMVMLRRIVGGSKKGEVAKGTAVA